MNFLIKMLGGYTKDEVLTEAVKHLYNTIGAEDILKEEGGQWTFTGKPVEDAMRKLLISEAQVFIKSRLWKVIQLDVKYQANKKMFEEAVSQMDMVMGKSWVYVLDCMKTRLESLNKGKGMFNAKNIK